ncbi:MAG: hypothetical protein WCO60_17055 [Verrucomicrobiota bacterium]
MKLLSHFLALSLLPIALGHAAAPEKKTAPEKKSAAPEKPAAPDLALAKTWLTYANALVGKSVSTVVQEVLEIGQVTSNAPCAVVPIVTGNEKGELGGEILALVPIAETQAFLDKATVTADGKATKFGTKSAANVTTGTLVLAEGELVLVIGSTMPVLGGKKPSALLAAQRGQK